jgi:pimeloyl-ACP methyl ester carboxylesterase
MTTTSRTALSRRAFLKSSAAGAAAVTAWQGGSSLAHVDQAIFVLVHPAWFGGWCWRKIVPLLRARGHEVYAPTLTGLGERAHLADRGIGLATHVQDVVNAMEYEDLRRVILVGNSSGGMVITGVAERVPERLERLVYLDAFVPENGQSLVDLLSAERRQAMEELVESEGQGWLLPRFAPLPWEKIVRDAWGVASAEDVNWIVPRLKPTPFRHFTDSVQRGNPAAAKVGCTFIRCQQFRQPAFDRHARVAQETAKWRYRVLATPHLPYVTHPAQLAEVLCDLAA